MKPLSLALMLGIVATPVVALAAVQVSSDSGCPSSDAITDRLLGLLPVGGPVTAMARVHSEGEAIRIELATPGEANRERIVPANGNCQARAEMVALIIASWLDALPVGSVDSPGAPPRKVEAAPVVNTVPGIDASPQPAWHRALVGAGFFGLADSQGASAGFALEAAMPNLLGDFGWSAQAALGLPRQMAVGQGTARYWRPTFTLAATGELRATNWVVRPHVGVALGVLSVKGSDYVGNRSATTVTWGADAGLTVARSWRQGEIWLRLAGLVWPQGRSVRSSQVPSGPDIEAPLPDWEVRLAAGIAWGIR